MQGQDVALLLKLAILNEPQVPSKNLAESRKTGVPLPSLHSALFAPVYAPAIETGVAAMTAMTLDLLK